MLVLVGAAAGEYSCAVVEKAKQGWMDVEASPSLPDPVLKATRDKDFAM